MPALFTIRPLSRRTIFIAMIAATWLPLATHSGEKIKFSDSSTPVVSSNLTATLAPPVKPFGGSISAFKQAQEDLLAPLRNSIDLDDPTVGTPLMPARRLPTQSLTKREQQLLDQRRNWAFTDLNDLYPDLSGKQSLALEEQKAMGQEKKSVSLVERYYEDRGVLNPHKLGANQGDYYGVRQSLTNNGLGFMTKVLSQNDGTMKTILAAAMMAGNNGQAFALSGNASLMQERDDKMAADKRMDDFRHLLDPSLPATVTVNHLDPFANNSALHSASSSFTTGTTVAAQMSQAKHTMSTPLSGTLDPTTAALHSSVDQDPTAVALGLANPYRAKPVTPPPPAKTMQQMLDPFTAGQPKSKF